MVLSPDLGKHSDALLDSLLRWAIFSWVMEYAAIEGKSSLNRLSRIESEKFGSDARAFSHALNSKHALALNPVSFFKPLFSTVPLFDGQTDSWFIVPSLNDWMIALPFLLSMIATATSRSAPSRMNCLHFITYLQNISESQLHKLLSACALSTPLGSGRRCK
jgi:hypothetical protein